jgi:hypothetical protein
LGFSVFPGDNGAEFKFGRFLGWKKTVTQEEILRRTQKFKSSSAEQSQNGIAQEAL